MGIIQTHSKTSRTLPRDRRSKVANVAGAPAGLLASQLLELYPLLLRELRRGMDPSGHAQLTISQCRILAFVAEEPTTNKALAAQVGVSVAATSRMVDGLVSRGLLDRTRDQVDKRQCHLHLSAEGRKHYLSFRRTAEEVLAKRLKSLLGEDLFQVSQSLELLLGLFAPSSANT